MSTNFLKIEIHTYVDAPLAEFAGVRRTNFGHLGIALDEEHIAAPAPHTCGVAFRLVRHVRPNVQDALG